MERLELIVVQLEEAKRLIGTDRVPQLRLAFILLDNATEVVLHRTVETALGSNNMYTNMLEQWRRFEAAGDTSKIVRDTILDLESKVIAKRELREIDRNFNAKIDFLLERDLLDDALGPVLKKLHHYRNETYHRDKLRRELIRPAVLIYFDAACSVLDFYSPGFTVIGEPVGPELDRFITGQGITGLDLIGADIHKIVAKKLRREVGLDLDTVRSALVAHLTARLEDLDEDLCFVEESLPVPGLVPRDGLLLVQADFKGNPSLATIRSRTHPYTAADLESWKHRTSALASVDDKYAMFTEYAAIEDAFEPLEEKAQKAVYDIDREIQLQMDIARGK